MAVPLRLAGEAPPGGMLLGVLQIVRPTGLPFYASECEILGSLARQAALGIQTALTIIDERWRMQQLALVRQVNKQIVNLRDLDEICRRITLGIRSTFNYYYVVLFTLEPGQSQLEFRASAGPQALEGEPEPQPVQVCLGDGIIGHVAETGREVLARDVSREPLYRPIHTLPETRSEAALPLMVQDRLLGVLDVQSDQVDDFDETDMLVLRTLAANIAVAVEDAWLFRALRRRAGQLEAIYAISNAISSILDQETLLKQVVELIRDRFGYPYVHLFSVHPGRRKVFYEAGTYGAALKQAEFAFDLDDPQGLVPWVARNGLSALVNDVSQDERYRASILPPDETRSSLTVPLLFGGEVLGVLDVESDEINTFGDEDRFLFEALADHIAIALRNATLYHSEQWRRHVAESMREVAGLLSADADLDQVLREIMQQLEQSLPLEAAAIWLLDEDDDKQALLESMPDYPTADALDSAGAPPAADAPPMEPAPLRLAAVSGPAVAGLDLELGLTSQEVLASNPARAPGAGAGASADEAAKAAPRAAPLPTVTWLRQALSAETAISRTEQSPFEPLGAVLGFPTDYSAAAAPLRVGDHLLGLLTLIHRTANRYGSEARGMTAAFASYAAVAIENTRLYEAAHEQAWVSTVLLQVAEATQAVTNLNELLNTVIRITPMLAGVKACLLYILDEDGDFIPAAASELSADQQAEFERWRFAPGDVAALDHLTSEHRPIILHDDADDHSLTRLFSSDDNHPPGLAVLIPLQARGEVLGALVVEYSTGPEGLRGRSLEAFLDERLAILQGIAHQTAVAVDNMRLLRMQKEDAYISVALLQVAQAVVSSNDLDEALGSIVRITPILVGVKRALVYLWDAANRRFTLAQAYGAPYAADQPVFAAGQFPLLDAVLQEDTVLATPLWDEPPGGEQVPMAWAALPPPTPNLMDDYLENAPCLLLALPLKVKTNVLGVFLVEEPEPGVAQSGLSGSGNRRLRRKRLEIITGISHQAALAIQNDLLQRETVERERMAREMQLAREIQTAFLPQELPQLRDWDLQVLWCTAREVGGDFYDFFPLPGNRFGLVMADVADKGMPAALFMTLVRTLLRATVSQVDSPAAVLMRVNDIIAPEAYKGMFVTLFYGVLDLDTGALEYANAGHNPPLLMRPAVCAVERLERTGMALGVEEHTRLSDGKCRIAPGDALILYTDGVTEAFDPSGDIFTEARLLETIQRIMCQATPPDAAAILDEIDAAVKGFTAGADASDDLTLLVIKYSGA